MMKFRCEEGADSGKFSEAARQVGYLHEGSQAAVLPSLRCGSGDSLRIDLALTGLPVPVVEPQGRPAGDALAGAVQVGHRGEF